MKQVTVRGVTVTVRTEQGNPQDLPAQSWVVNLIKRIRKTLGGR